MPTSRKRIGFLPTEEVKDIIDKICLKNNLSQSKVTGILVEEALKVRNLYKSKNIEGNIEIVLNNELEKSKISNNINYLASKNNDIDKYKEDEEYKLIKEYLNYKNFKKILSLVQTEKWGLHKKLLFDSVTLIKWITLKKCRLNMINTINNNNSYDLFENKSFKFFTTKS